MAAMTDTRNPLERFLSRRNAPSMRSLATAVGVNHGTLSRYISGSRIPDIRVAYELERVTKGAVPARYWARLPR